VKNIEKKRMMSSAERSNEGQKRYEGEGELQDHIHAEHHVRERISRGR